MGVATINFPNQKLMRTKRAERRAWRSRSGREKKFAKLNAVEPVKKDFSYAAGDKVMLLHEVAIGLNMVGMGRRDV